MKIDTKPLTEINQLATHILCREMGVVDTIRFINQFATGYGDYTKEREKLFGDLSLKEIVSEIKNARH